MGSFAISGTGLRSSVLPGVQGRRQQLPLVIDDEVEMKAEVPSHQGFAPSRQVLERLVNLSPLKMTDGDRGRTLQRALRD